MCSWIICPGEHGIGIVGPSITRRSGTAWPLRSFFEHMQIGAAGRTVIRATTYRLAMFSLGLIFLGASVGGTYEKSARSDTKLGWIAIAASLAFMTRALRLGILVDGDRLQARSWFRTRTFSTSEIVYVSPERYDGLLKGAGESRLVHTIALTIRDGSVFKAYGVIGGRSGTRKRAAKLSAALHL